MWKVEKMAIYSNANCRTCTYKWLNFHSLQTVAEFPNTFEVTSENKLFMCQYNTRNLILFNVMDTHMLYINLYYTYFTCCIYLILLFFFISKPIYLLLRYCQWNILISNNNDKDLGIIWKTKIIESYREVILLRTT